ncbi:MAG: hypothetical protein SFT68_04285 [Rickettsiaceae bacterium]|nr:hypothetical protein [Rickettsiaceae bacterium]
MKNNHKKNMLPKFEESVALLQNHLEDEIEDLKMQSAFDQKHKTQKNLADTLHKLVTTIKQLKKLEKLFEQEEIFDEKLDQQIIDEFIAKVLKDRTKIENT